MVWWLSRICCTSCSTEKPELLFPLLQVHLMPWTAGRGRAVRGRAGQGEAGERGAQVFPQQSPSLLGGWVLGQIDVHSGVGG